MPSKQADALWPEKPEDLPLEPPVEEMTDLVEQCLEENDGGMLLDILSQMALLRQAAASACEQERPDLEPPRRPAPRLSGELVQELVQALSDAAAQNEGTPEERVLGNLRRKLQGKGPGRR